MDVIDYFEREAKSTLSSLWIKYSLKVYQELIQDSGSD